jgi:hypothetical protein
VYPLDEMDAESISDLLTANQVVDVDAPCWWPTR